jgi:hypothetical protein
MRHDEGTRDRGAPHAIEAYAERRGESLIIKAVERKTAAPWGGRKDRSR